MALSMFEQASSLLLGLFDYNRENFSFDRRQRQIMEYQLLDKRIEQGDLWREDVRGSLGLVPEKMDVYLTVIALELTLVGVALCKGRMPFGAPTWLVATRCPYSRPPCICSWPCGSACTRSWPPRRTRSAS